MQKELHPAQFTLIIFKKRKNRGLAGLAQMKLSPRQRAFRALLGGKTDRTPVTTFTGCGGAVNVDMQKATGIFWPDAHMDPELMAELAIAGYEIGGIECVKIPFHNIGEAEALGCKTRYPQQKYLYPVVTEHPFTKPQDLKMPDQILDSGRLPVILEAIRIARKRVGDFLPISSHVSGPFTLACELVGMERFSIWSLKNIGYVKTVLDFATEVIIAFGKAQYRAGSDFVTVADGSLARNLVTPEVLNDCLKPALSYIAQNLPGIRLLYIGGKEEAMVPFLAACGFDGISVAETVDIAKIKPIVGEVKIIGNVSSKVTLTKGSPKEVESEVRKAIDGGADLVEPSCGIPPETPTANIKAMAEAVKTYGTQIDSA
jgi:[methyl-Co(III) methanol-specific corrinoid protein]:coenzyme M methyltransferase